MVPTRGFFHERGEVFLAETRLDKNFPVGGVETRLYGGGVEVDRGVGVEVRKTIELDGVVSGGGTT